VAISYTQSRNATSLAVTSIALAFNSNVSAGNPGLIVGVRDGLQAGDSGNITVSDNVNAGNYALDLAQSIITDGDTSAIFSHPNAGAGATTVTMALTTGSATLSLAIHEIAGLATSAMLDKTASANNTSTAPNSGNTAATTQASELVFGFLALDGIGSETITSGGGATQRENDSLRIASNTLVVSSTGVQSAAFTLSVSEEWACLCATYKGAAATASFVQDSVYVMP
jgi:hypothetical protein